VVEVKAHSNRRYRGSAMTVIPPSSATGSNPVAHGATLAASFVDVLALEADLGLALGHRLVLLSLERWREFADLRFARIDEEGIHRLTRRVPTASAWKIGWSPTARTAEQSQSSTSQAAPPGDVPLTQSEDAINVEVVEVVEVVGRGGRTFSNGEARIIGPSASAALTHGFLHVEVTIADGAHPLRAVINLAP